MQPDRRRTGRHPTTETAMAPASQRAWRSPVPAFHRAGGAPIGSRRPRGGRDRHALPGQPTVRPGRRAQRRLRSWCRQRGGRHPPPRSGDRGRDPDAGWSPTGERLRADHAAPTTAGDTRADGVAAEFATPDATPEASAMGETVAVSLMEFAIDMPSELPAGPTTFEITNDGTIEHNFEVEGQGIEEERQRTRPGRNRYAHGGPGAWHLRGLLPSREPRG